jgi:hypothetical protein
MADRLTAEQVEALRTAEAMATKGPWFAVSDGEDETKAHVIATCAGINGHEQSFANANFIVEARNAMPSLLAELAALRAENQRLYKLACDAAPTMAQVACDVAVKMIQAAMPPGWSDAFWAEVSWRNGMGPEPT